jgi:alanine racemase
MPSKADQTYRSWVEVDLDNFTINWNEMKRLVGPDVKILQVVKADAYGHGAIEISNVALKNGASFLGVANADEGVQLRVSGITAPILIMSPSTGSEINEIIKYNLTPSVSDLNFARELQKRFKKAEIKAPVHIEVDTGMGRGGTMHLEAFSMIKEILSYPNIIVEGIFTHLSGSETMSDYNDMQWNLFKDLLNNLAIYGINIPLRHMANSGAVLNYPGFYLDMVRPGIMSYGVYPGLETKTKATLAPVMTFKTRIVLIKEFPRGYSIGYGRTYITDRPTKIATIPVGYGDGYGRILSNQGEALISGKRVPVIGRVSMDMSTLDVSKIRDCQVGDEVVLMGSQGHECISADEVADKMNTISYEILCALGKRAPRIFIHKGKTDSIEPRLRRIFIPEEEKSISRIDSIIRHCFQTRARDEELGNAIYYEMFETLFGREDRQLELRTNFKYNITVANFPREEIRSDRSAGEYFKVTTHVEYTKMIKYPVFMIACALNDEQLSAFFEDKRCEYRWLLNRGDDLDLERDFRVSSVRLDGENIPIIRSENTQRGYEVWCGDESLRKKIHKQARVEIEIVTKKAKSSNTFSVYLVYPTRGLDISFNYEGVNFKYVKEVSFFSGKQPYPEVIRKKGKSIRLLISDDEWIFPNSGVTFFWGF